MHWLKHRNDISVKTLNGHLKQQGWCGSYGTARCSQHRSFGNPELSEVNIGVRNNSVSWLAVTTRKTWKNWQMFRRHRIDVVNAHSEMLPAHYYPHLKKYKHLAVTTVTPGGNKRKFESFNGLSSLQPTASLPPTSRQSYKDRIYTIGAWGLDGAIHIVNVKMVSSKDFCHHIARNGMEWMDRNGMEWTGPNKLPLATSRIHARTWRRSVTTATHWQ